MRKSLREIFKTLFLVLASVNLGISSEMLPLGIIFALGFLYLHWRLEKPTPLYKKRFAYGAIVPYALWWVVTPEVENGISPYGRISARPSPGKRACRSPGGGCGPDSAPREARAEPGPMKGDASRQKKAQPAWGCALSGCYGLKRCFAKISANRKSSVIIVR